jgi:probable rRNA maturation factor
MPAAYKLTLAVQYPDARLRETVPRGKIRQWVKAALMAPAELTIRFVDADEGRALNRDYRGKDYATNVLTFAYTEDEESESTQADLILCTDVVVREAKEQGKTIEAHAAHLIVHGVLHAQGYDHEAEDEAVEMESLETDILAKLGFDDPYRAERQAADSARLAK